MQDQYISLNPDNTAREEKAIRKNLYEQRLTEAQGGKASMIVGSQWGLTASVFMYSYLTKDGFKLFPFAASKSPAYGKIAAAFLGFYMIGHGWVMGKFGDSK